MTPPPRLYLAGPMTGIPEHNYPAFDAAETALRALGAAVLNPTHNEQQNRSGTHQTWDWYMRLSIHQVVLSTGVALLPGWEDSRGARLEHHIATELGLDVAPLADWLRRLQSMPPAPSGYVACRVIARDRLITHLVALDESGSNGGRPTMCGLTRFDRFENGRPIPNTADLPGWGMGDTGVTGPGVRQIKCGLCYGLAATTPALAAEGTNR